ncbi:MAG: hypothetical protein KHY08_02875 [Lachnospiraceae bacterium]|nr:hypothetical protein [Lachnospiraceae bacterium]HJC80449.1 hypothetical protein [Candidatus Mediterraneibacter excrementipullorum]
MTTIRFDLNDEYKKKLEQAAEKQHMCVQDYIRYKLFGMETIFTVDEAVKKIQNGDYYDTSKYPDGFTLPDIYGEDWTIERGPAGVFGRKFYNFITDNPDLGINYKDMGKNGRRAHYTYNKNEQQCD